MNEPTTPLTPFGGARTSSSTKFEEKKPSAATGLGAIVHTAMEEYRDKADQALGHTRQRVWSLQKEGENYVRTNPMKAVFAALGLGFLLAFLLRR